MATNDDLVERLRAVAEAARTGKMPAPTHSWRNAAVILSGADRIERDSTVLAVFRADGVPGVLLRARHDLAARRDAIFGPDTTPVVLLQMDIDVIDRLLAAIDGRAGAGERETP